jgi:hypothetical protein
MRNHDITSRRMRHLLQSLARTNLNRYQNATHQGARMASQQRDSDHACFIIHAHRPYCFDLNEALALPSGLRYRNRFDFQWVAANLRDEIKKLLGRQVLLVLRDPDHNTLIPVRWGNVVTVLPVGKVVFFEYILGDLIQYSTAPNVRHEEIVARTKDFSDQHDWLPGPLGAAMTSPSVFLSTAGAGLPKVDASDLTAWGNAVSALATAPVYSGIEFLKIVGLYGSDGRSKTISNESYVVRPNTVYTLRVWQQIAEPPQIVVPAHSVEVRTFPDHIIALRYRQQAVGKYDMLTFVLRVLTLGRGERTAIEIPHVPDAATEGKALTSIYLPLTVSAPSPGRLTLIIVLLLASLALIFYPHLDHLPVDVVRNVGTIIFVLTLAGPSRALASMWPSWPWGVGK